MKRAIIYGIGVLYSLMGCGASQTESDLLDYEPRVAVSECGEHETLRLRGVSISEAMTLAYQLDRAAGAPERPMLSDEARPGIEKKLCFLDFNKDGVIQKKEYEEGANLLSTFPAPKGGKE